MDFDLSEEQNLPRQAIRVFAERQIAPVARELDGREEFSAEVTRIANALGYRYDPRRPTSFACSAKYDGVIVGLAATSVDCDSMWQVGIDVLPGYRNQGIGKALVSRLTEALFKVRKLPCYSTGTSNISSGRIAISLGYRPAWVEIYSREPRSH